MSLILMKNACKDYNKGTNAEISALKTVNLEIEAGEFIAIEGRSGSGKSTLLNIIGCIDFLTSGDYWLEGVNTCILNDREISSIRNSKIGFVLQEFGLISNKTVLENVSIPLMFSKVKLKEMKGKCLDALTKVGMEQYVSKKVNQLSGGQKQRVAIARAIVNDPDIILADEPTGALDSKTTIEIMDLLRELNSNGRTIIIVTHDKIVSQYCTRKYTIDDGFIYEGYSYSKQN